MQEHGIPPIDLVVVNLYPFEQTVAKPDVTLHDAIENIDIGGPSMLRSAAKNHDSVTVVVDPLDYAEVAKQISGQRQHDAGTAPQTGGESVRAHGGLRRGHCGASAEGIRSRHGLRPAAVACRFPRRWRSRCVTAKIRTRRRRFTAGSTNFSSSCTARNFPTTTFWI